MGVTVEEVVALGPVIPVVVLEEADDGPRVARALQRGGVHVVEVTLRTPAALEAIERIAATVPEVLVGAGTVVSGIQVTAAAAAGADFLVSPGATPTLLDAMQDSGLPLLPGAATPSEVMALLERGLRIAKLYPAEALGGTALLRALDGPFPSMSFCPTGGIDERTAPAYLSLPNVACVGGSWPATRAAIRAGDWAAVTRLASVAQSLAPGRPRVAAAAVASNP